MKRRPRQTDILDWEELEEAPNTRGAFSFLRPQGTVVDIADHRPSELMASGDIEASNRPLVAGSVPTVGVLSTQDMTATVDILSTVEIMPTVDSMSVVENPGSEGADRHSSRKGNLRPYKEHRCFRVQDAHSPGENQLFAALHNAAKPDGEDRRITIGWTRMSALSGLSDKAVKRLTGSLIAKLALELIAPENSATKTGRTYRIYSFTNILKRRNSAGLQWVIKDKGVRFVSKRLSIDEDRSPDSSRDITSTLDIASTEAVNIPSTLTGDRTDTVKGDIPSTPLRSVLRTKKEETTTTTEDLAKVVEALSMYAVADDDVARRIVRGARTHCADALASEIVAVIHLKAPEIVRSRSIRNPLGLLTYAIPLCFEGSGITRLRAAWAAERERDALRQAEREQSDREMKQWIERLVSDWQEVLANPMATGKEKENAKRQILQFRPELLGG